MTDGVGVGVERWRQHTSRLDNQWYETALFAKPATPDEAEVGDDGGLIAGDYGGVAAHARKAVGDSALQDLVFLAHETTAAVAQRASMGKGLRGDEHEVGSGECPGNRAGRGTLEVDEYELLLSCESGNGAYEF